MILLQIENFSAYCEEACLIREAGELIKRSERDDYERCGENLQRTIRRVWRPFQTNVFVLVSFLEH